mmetsp:Transcript_32976/g.82899  ORF Transcript_32976/g.82899 Transcript_32976/m.82899 type:complete len:251 (-) Transcript_32976:721-1473(-)
MASYTRKYPDVLCLFDVDGTLTAPRKKATDDVLAFLEELRKRTHVGIVGGSDIVKQREQLGENIIDLVDYAFGENGLVAFKNGEKIHQQSIKGYVSEEKMQSFLNFVLRYIADLSIPVKRGTFVEFRSGMLNISPIGRNCSQEERDAFEQYDKVHNVRQKFVEALKKEFADLGLKFVIGGQISFDVFPEGWDKTYCLRHVKSENFKEIHFFGDKTFEGGNDYEIFVSPDVKGHSVTSYQHTMELVNSLFP